ncbi:Na+/H+ antiporter subunit E [Halolamina sp.]|jgi:multicomponent Na+:H+ antiporter subunit E|uniref:Na+/H+ antiporter subunit E n=1 Tax=Halolamina sp. TaxID=1940283 RepID=UPI000223BBD6|nr:cation antiporter [halophilic archaeon DL31]
MSRRWPANGLLLAVLWLFVRGMELTPARIAEEFVIGLAIGMPLAFAIRRLYPPSLPVSRSLRIAPYAAFYIVIFLKDLVVANFSVARLVLSPNLPIEPAVVEVPLRVRSDIAVTTIANSITLTPGTLTMDYDAKRNSLYVHSIAAPDHESVIDPIRVWEEYALAIFDEELKPGDPVPDPDSVEHGDAAFGGENDE